MVFTQQTSETALSIWLSENALSHCAQFLTAEGWTSPLDFRELRGKDVATIRQLIPNMTGPHYMFMAIVALKSLVVGRDVNRLLDAIQTIPGKATAHICLFNW